MSDDILTTLKIIVVGSMGVGKTRYLLCASAISIFDTVIILNIISRLLGEDFAIHKPTLTPAHCRKRYLYNGKTVLLSLWDTAGQERFNSLPSMLYRDIQGAVLVYDVTDYRSYRDLHRFLTDLEARYEDLEKPVYTILGNKIDMDGREVPRQDGLSLAKRHSALFLETSARTNEGVEPAFDDLVAKIMATPGLWKRNEQSKRITLQALPANEITWYQSCVPCWN